ncbi:uncharacterized protein An03g05720 [Aspergillus niger]|uniref:Contig An03c0180, genomic contig n=2 Tax=Aspergillus niger TaxID=5061 RepID=A2QH62_ASPNC|nr:uncharacterized protein An03g05720 [Aspergillus niger]CAK38332.1 unnamed protein product [Aspergillus niger]
MPLRVAEDGKIMVGVSYALRGLGVRGGEDDEYLIEKWPVNNSSEITTTKVPTILQHDPVRWGAQVIADTENCSSLFKPLLEPNFDRDNHPYAFWNSTVGHGGFSLPADKTATDVIKDYLEFVWMYSKRIISDNTRKGLDYHPVHYTITVPGIWARETRKALEQIVKAAGLATKASDILTMIPEPIAAAVDVFRKKANTFRGDDVMLVCDIGGGTIDVGSVLIRQTVFGRYIRQLEPTRGNLGMLSVEAAFYRTMVSRFGNAFIDQDAKFIGPSSALIRGFRNCFEKFVPENLEERGWAYRLPFRPVLSTSNPEYYDRRKKEIILSARDIQVFLDPVVDMAHVYLVGGGAENAYILRSVQRRIKNEHALDVYTPDQPQLAVVNGAGVYGLDDVLSIHRCPQSIGFECVQQYDADRHGQPRPGLLTRDPVDGREIVTEAAIWVFDMGRTYHEGAVETENVVEYFLESEFGDRHKNIFVSGDLRPPAFVTNLDPLTAIEIRFRQVPAGKKEVREVGGRRQVRICYEISTTFLPIDNKIEFVARIGNQEIGRRMINMPFH